jgi:hypothetical protein
MVVIKEKTNERRERDVESLLTFNIGATTKQKKKRYGLIKDELKQ